MKKPEERIRLHTFPRLFLPDGKISYKVLLVKRDFT